MERATDFDIAYAYRLLLKREPDPGGLEHYRRRIQEGLSLHDLVASVVSSDEYHARLEADAGEDEAAGHASPDEAAGGFAPDAPIRLALRRHLAVGHVVVDVGARAGAVTVFAASIVGDQGRVVAVEADPDQTQRLYRNLVRGGVTNVDVLPLAASDRRDVVSLVGRTDTSLSAATSARGPGRFVQTVRLDDALGDLPRLDFVRMDLEGHEPRAIQGFQRNLARHRPTLLLEFNPPCLDAQGQDRTAYLDQIFAIAPRVRVIGPAGDAGMYPNAETVLALWRRDPSRHLDLLASND